MSSALAVVERGRSAKTEEPPPNVGNAPSCHICMSRPEHPATMGGAPDVPLNQVVAVSLALSVVGMASKQSATSGLMRWSAAGPMLAPFQLSSLRCWVPSQLIPPTETMFFAQACGREKLLPVLLWDWRLR